MAGEGNALPVEFENVKESFDEVVAVEFPTDGAIAEFEEWFNGFGELFQQMGEAMKKKVEELQDSPLAPALLDHLGEVADSLIASADSGNDAYTSWRTEHEYDISRQEDPREGEEMLNVKVGGE